MGDDRQTGTDDGAGAAGIHPLLPLQVRGLSLEVRGQTIIRDISFTIASPGRTVILGPNGAGKTTLLRLCHGLGGPTAGDIRWGTMSAADGRGHHAMVPQRPVLLRRSVAGNLRHVLRLKKVPKDRWNSFVEMALQQAGLGSLALRPARTLSGGEQKRLVIARACLLEPAVLLLDEPTANLDPAAVRSVEAMIRTVSEAGTKVLITTHDIAQAKRLAEDVMFMNNGCLIEHAPAKQFFEAPRDSTAARFLDGELLC